MSRHREPLAKTVATVARDLHVAPEVVKTWIGQGLLRAVELPGGRIRILASDLEAFVESRYVTPMPLSRANGRETKTWF